MTTTAAWEDLRGRLLDAGHLIESPVPGVAGTGPEVEAIIDGVVAAVRAQMPEDECLMELGDFFKVFGDSTRVKILCALGKAEMCVCDIAALLGMTRSAISHQLRVLKQSKIVKYRRDGKVVYYSLDDEHVKGIFAQGLSHILER